MGPGPTDRLKPGRRILIVRYFPKRVFHLVIAQVEEHVDPTVVGHRPVMFRFQGKLVVVEYFLKVGLYLYACSYEQLLYLIGIGIQVLSSGFDISEQVLQIGLNMVE